MENTDFINQRKSVKSASSVFILHANRSVFYYCLLLTACCLLVLFSACGSGDGSLTSGYSGHAKIVMKLNDKPTDAQLKAGMFKTIPPGITKITITVTSQDAKMDTVKGDIPLDGSELVLLVPAGQNRVFQADAYNGTTLTYSGITVRDLTEGEEVWLPVTLYPLDEISPTVSSVSPANNAAGAAINTAITAAFSEIMYSSMITTDTFTLKDSSDNAISGTVTYSDTTATFTPSSNLSYSTTYTATITTDAEDYAGNNITSDYTWSFTTGSAPDTTAPTVSSTSPASGATGIAINTSITATFSETIDTSTITTATFTVGGATGTVTYSGTTATFTPSSNLSYSTTYTATLTTGVKDSAGNAMAANYTWQFTTGSAPDTTAPTVSSTSPASGATGIAINTSITATFSETIDTSTITTATFTVGGATGTVTYSGTTATFTPSSNLSYSTTYTATLTTGVKDSAGNAMAANYTWQFTTGSATVTTLKADYQFQNTLASSVGTAPVLINLGSNTFGTTTVDSITRTVLNFTQGNGLSLSPTTDIISNSTYSVVVLFSFTNISGYCRILDFKNQGSDKGLYNYNGNLNFYNIAIGSGTPITANSFVQVVLTRDSSKNVVGYVNSTQQFSFVDSSDDALIDTNNILRFFRDDLVVSGEASAGSVARIRLYNVALSAAEVSALDRLPSSLMGGSIQSTALNLTSANAAVTTFAGSAGTTGSTDATGTSARFKYPYSITTDGTNLFIADSSNHTIRKIVISTGVVTTIAGSAGVYGSTDGTGTSARFNYPYGITTDGTNLFVADTYNHTIRKIVISTGVVTTIAGSAGVYGSTDGTGTSARFNYPYGITTDGTNLFVADTYNHTIRKIVISTGVVTTIAGSAGVYGSTDGTGTAALFNSPHGITTDGTNLFVADMGNSTIRKIVISTGVVTTIAGSAGAYGSTDGTGSAARFSSGSPCGITTDGTNLFVTDMDNHTIRKIVISTAAVTTIAGSAGVYGSTDATGTSAKFNYPGSITTDGTNLFVADTYNHTIRKIQ